MTQDEIKAMFELAAAWRMIITYPTRILQDNVIITCLKKTTMTCMTDYGMLLDMHFPTKARTIEARPGYLHYTSTHGNDIVLEKI